MQSAGDVTIKIQCVIDEQGHALLYCHSPAREQNDRAIDAAKTTGFEAVRVKLAAGLSKPRGTKDVARIMERLGRARQRYARAAQRYQVELAHGRHRHADQRHHLDYMWAYARGAFEPEPGVVFDFCVGRGGKYPIEFLTGWTGTLVVDAYSGYDAPLALDGRSAAYRLAHAPGPRAWPTRGASSTNWSRPTRAWWRCKPSSASPGCTGSRPTPGS